MAPPIASFAELIAPVDEAAFLADHYEQRPLHIAAPDADRFADAMSWDILGQLLDMTAIWSAETLKLYLDTAPVAPGEYCRDAIDRTNQPGQQPDAAKVNDWLARGASLVANDIDTLWPGLAAVGDVLEARLGARSQANLYCSWRDRKAFAVHFDTHEVFAIHIAGEKVWRVYAGREANPVAAPQFAQPSVEECEANKGALLLEARLRPGDLLYIPRGQYHEALASSAGALHVTYGVTPVTGCDVLGVVMKHAFDDAAFRANLPLGGDGANSAAARRAHLGALARRLGELADSDAVVADVERITDSFRQPRGGIDLPGDALASDGLRFGTTATDLEIVARDGRRFLKSAKGAVPIPGGLEDIVGWIVERGEFSVGELDTAFPELDTAGRDRLLADLTAMKVIAPA